MKRLGERIRRKRESLNIPLGDLAKKVGISSSALSQIESAKAFPSILNLKAIADSLNTTVGEIIGEFETLSKNPRVKYSDRKFVRANSTGAKLFLLSHHDPYKQMDTYSVEFEPGSDAEDIMDCHPGQEFIYLVRGNVRILLDEKPYDLFKGDSFYFNSSEPHVIVNMGADTSEIIWVVTPPNI